jgi:hypothetical protein
MTSQPHDMEELIKIESSQGAFVIRQMNQVISHYPQSCQQSLHSNVRVVFFKCHLTTLKTARVIQRQEYMNELK